MSTTIQQQTISSAQTIFKTITTNIFNEYTTWSCKAQHISSVDYSLCWTMDQFLCWRRPQQDFWYTLMEKHKSTSSVFVLLQLWLCRHHGEATGREPSTNASDVQVRPPPTVDYIHNYSQNWSGLLCLDILYLWFNLLNKLQFELLFRWGFTFIFTYS